MKELKLGSFSEMKYGRMPDKSKLNEHGIYPVFSGYRIVGYTDECNLDKQELVVVARGVGGTGEVKLSPGACFLTNLSIAVIVDENVALKEYLYYYFQLHNLRYLDSGSAQSQITISDLKNVTVPIPPLEQQLAIVTVLKQYDRKIEINNSINDNLQQQAMALYKSWFVDFAPFGGAMPIGWNISSLGESTEMGAGGDKPKITSPTKTDECPYPIFSNGLNEYGLYGYTNEAKIHAESVTVSARGTIGFVCLRHVPYVPIVRLVTLIPKRELMSAKYLYLYLRQLNISGTGTTQQQLTVPDFRKTEVVIPVKETMTAFTELIDPMFEKMWENEEENAALSKIRDALLPKLMFGEIDISNIQI